MESGIDCSSSFESSLEFAFTSGDWDGGARLIDCS
jgi:hypothetical protein